jgi:hypothetical protein
MSEEDKGWTEKQLDAQRQERENERKAKEAADKAQREREQGQ